jgi:hypothetical protein
VQKILAPVIKELVSDRTDSRSIVIKVPIMNTFGHNLISNKE